MSIEEFADDGSAGISESINFLSIMDQNQDDTNSSINAAGNTSDHSRVSLDETDDDTEDALDVDDEDYELCAQTSDGAAATIRILEFVPADRIRGLSQAHVGAIDPSEFQNLDPVKLQAFTPVQISWLSASQLQSINVANLTVEQLGGISLRQIGALTNTQVASLEPRGNKIGIGLTTNQLNAFSDEQFRSLTPRALASLEEGPLVEATRNRRNVLTTEQLQGLSRQQLELVTDSVFLGNLTIPAIRQMSNDSARRFTAADFRRMLPGQLAAFSREQLAQNPEAIRDGITKHHVDALSDLQIQALGVSREALLRPPRVEWPARPKDVLYSPPPPSIKNFHK